MRLTHRQIDLAIEGFRTVTQKRLSNPTRLAARSVHANAEERLAALPIEELYERYPGEWVGVKVTRLDKTHNISHGVVLAHGTAQYEVSEAILRAHRKEPSIRTYVFLGGRSAASIEEWREHLAEAAARGSLNAWWCDCHPGQAAPQSTRSLDYLHDQPLRNP
jgi:hypothetical protein